MKEWNLQDIRPNRTPRRADASTERPPRMHERARDTQDAVPVRREMPAYGEASSEYDERPPRRVSFDDMPAEAPVQSQPLRRKMSLEPSPVSHYVKLAAIGATIIAAVIIYIAHVTATAVVTVVRRTADMSISATITAGDGSSLPYAIVTKSLEATISVPATGVTDINEKASGIITIYNEYDKKTFVLTKNTRFESAGKIFRIQESVTVPGYTISDAGAVVPGTVKAKVFADEAGEAGNIPETQFSIPGFKSDATQYTKVYARSHEVFTGGFIGKRAVVDSEVHETSRAQVEVALSEQLAAALTAEAVADQVMYAEGSVITYTDEIQTGASESEANLVVRGTIKAPVFSMRDLAKMVLRVQSERVEGDFVISNASTLTFAYVGEPSSLQPNTPITFLLSGDAHFVSVLPTNEIAEAIAGISIKDLQDVTVKYPGAERIAYHMTPAWRSSFPTDPNRITIEFKEFE